MGYVEYNWMADQYSGGCYTGVAAPGTLSTFGKFLAEPEGRIYFAGTETGTYWYGYMEGAIEAGERASSQVLMMMFHFDITQTCPFNILQYFTAVKMGIFR